MNQIDRDRMIYSLARDFLLSLKVPGVTEKLIEKYLKPATSKEHVTSLADIYRRMLESAQNANMKAGVVGKALGGVDKLQMVLLDFDPIRVLERYTTWKTIFDQVKNQLKPTGKMRETPRSIWPQYCRTIVSAARFISQFSTPAEFYSWVDFFDRDDRARVALPMLLDQEIDGFGFALACDFLKELGYVNFAKPDVHIRDIFKSLDLCEVNVNDYLLFKAIIRVAKNANVTPYNADKVFWLIGSGYFYDDENIGNKGRIGSRKTEFIRSAKRKLANATH